MQLKVGELARQSGLTVRTLHHYDEIGLLKPSGRSDSGYRLYSQQDVARLHGIQALRHLGLALSDIGALLDGRDAQPARIIEQQINALDRQIAQATELRGRLAMIQADIARGGTPQVGDWLQALSLMETYGKYFSADELKEILSSFPRIEPEWRGLMDEVRAAMDAGLAPESVPVQSLARRWMALMHHWMDGDFELMNRWGRMYAQEPTAQGRRGGPPGDMLAYMNRATTLRMELMLRHLDADDLARIRHVHESAWRAVNEAGRELIRSGTPPTSRTAKALAARWLALMDQLTGGDATLRAKFVDLHWTEPLLRASAPIDADLRTYLMKVLDPHAT